MAGPAPPSDVARFTLFGTAGRGRWQTGLWFWCPGLAGSADADRVDLANDLLLAVRELVSGLSHSSVVPTTCRLELQGSSGFAYTLGAGESRGAWDGETIAAASLAIYWHTGTQWRGGHGISWLPMLPNVFTDDAISLNATGRQQALTRIASFRAQIAAISLPTIPACNHVVVRRRSGNDWLAAAQFEPVVGGLPVLQIATQRRRLRSKVWTRF